MMISTLITISLIIAVLLCLVSFHFHRKNMDKVYDHICEITKNEQDEKGVNFSRDDFFKQISKISHGSNFNAALITAWMLFIVAFAYLYSLTPQISPDILLKGIIAGNRLGFGPFIFALALLILAAIPVIAFNYPRIYRFYEISKGEKTATLMAVPLLWISIASSVYLVTIHPSESTDPFGSWAIIIASITLLASLIILLFPIFKRAIG